MVITSIGNMVFFDLMNATVWQLFDHPTHALVPGQSLLEGMRLTTRPSASDVTLTRLKNKGYCWWVTKVFSLQSIKPKNGRCNNSVFIKVQLSPSNSAAPSAPSANNKILGTTIPAIITVVLLAIVVTLYLQTRSHDKNDEDFNFDQLTRMPARFSFQKKSQRLLVYKYMPRGPLDRWINYRHNNAPLDWRTRCRTTLDIAKGLCYLHKECRRKIAHLDIKPQNILLDEKFNAKVGYFGLSKLIDRDQKQVSTTGIPTGRHARHRRRRRPQRPALGMAEQAPSAGDVRVGQGPGQQRPQRKRLDSRRAEAGATALGGGDWAFDAAARRGSRQRYGAGNS
uniref:non-specific serine/threonine protein kinase n=1 Tax=Aegilops tauschii TaxID=37682 RepID=M8BXP4_AEGTA